MRLRAFLPAYLLLAATVAYALVSLWTGLDRLDAIEEYTQASARSERAVAQIESLLTTTLDLEIGAQGYVFTGDEAYLAMFDRGRARAPQLLAELRGSVRDQPVKLAQIEQLVPQLADLISTMSREIERRRASGEVANPVVLAWRDRKIFEGIHGALVELLTRERAELGHHRDTLLVAQQTARRDLYVQSGLMLTLVVALLLALRRIRNFVHPRPVGVATADHEGDTPVRHHAILDTLLRDAGLRARVAIDEAPADSVARAHLTSLQRTLERALDEHIEVLRDRADPTPDDVRLPDALSQLAARYSTPDGRSVNASVDLAAHVSDRQTAHLIRRSAEWALEVIAMRKRAGEVRLDCGRDGSAIALRISALPDDAARTLALSPREQESAGILRRAIAQRGGSFELTETPTGLVVAVRLPDAV